METPTKISRGEYKEYFTKLKEKVIAWIKNYMNSFGGETKVVIGISGGKDSTVVAKLCVEAIGADRVIGVRLPQGNQHDLDVAKKVCDYLGIKSYEFNIKSIADSIDVTLSADFAESVHTNSVHYSNMPARVRMTILYSIAALIGNARVANTCNLSEDYVGYSTKYGDSAGDFSPLSRLTVWEVIEIGSVLGIPEEFLFKKPEDGLSGKTDEENLGFTYEALDNYLLFGIDPGDEILENIQRRHAANLHKLAPMPAFELAEYRNEYHRN